MDMVRGGCFTGGSGVLCPVGSSVLFGSSNQINAVATTQFRQSIFYWETIHLIIPPLQPWVSWSGSLAGILRGAALSSFTLEHTSWLASSGLTAWHFTNTWAQLVILKQNVLLIGGFFRLGRLLWLRIRRDLWKSEQFHDRAAVYINVSSWMTLEGVNSYANGKASVSLNSWGILTETLEQDWKRISGYILVEWCTAVRSDARKVALS